MRSLAIEEAVARSVFDRATAAAEDAERRWPHNEFVLADPRMDARLRDALVGPDDRTAWGGRVRPDVLTILWTANGTAHAVGQSDDIASLAERTYPLSRGQIVTCDRCEELGPIYGAVLLLAGCKLVGLLCCGACAYDLTTAGYQPTWTRPATTKE